MTRQERMTRGAAAQQAPLSTGRPVPPPRRGHLADLAAAWASSVRDSLTEAGPAGSYAAQLAADDAPAAAGAGAGFLDRAGMAGRTRSQPTPPGERAMAGRALSRP